MHVGCAPGALRMSSRFPRASWERKGALYFVDLAWLCGGSAREPHAPDQVLEPSSESGGCEPS
eukprot:13201595-Alexandrium_andersonii.AAC.1